MHLHMPQVLFYPNSVMMESEDQLDLYLKVSHNYAIHDKELLSVIRRLEEWQHILEGTKHKVDILNDY